MEKSAASKILVVSQVSWCTFHLGLRQHQKRKLAIEGVCLYTRRGKGGLIVLLLFQNRWGSAAPLFPRSRTPVWCTFEEGSKGIFEFVSLGQWLNLRPRNFGFSSWKPEIAIVRNLFAIENTIVDCCTPFSRRKGGTLLWLCCVKLYFASAFFMRPWQG